jgi:hypothetical protein
MTKLVGRRSPLTMHQTETMGFLSKHVGQIVDVQTAEAHRDGIPAWPQNWRPVGRSSQQTLRGLEKRGLITILDTYWQGARIQVL